MCDVCGGYWFACAVGLPCSNCVIKLATAETTAEICFAFWEDTPVPDVCGRFEVGLAVSLALRLCLREDFGVKL